MSLLSLAGITVLRGSCPVVDDVSFAVQPGEFIGLLGPNGAGKTTLMRAALGLIEARGHSSLAGLTPGARARAAAWLPQAREIAWGLSVADVVGLGRLPHPRPDAAGPAAIAAALAEMGLENYRTRIATQVSGGEQARVLIARALAQSAPLILADEPIAGLDPAAQIATMQVFARHARAGGAVVASLHDLGLAARHCSRVLVLDRGRLVADGAPLDVLTPDLLAGTFHIRAHVSTGPQGPIFQPLTTLNGF
ncbi:ABC transporter ATP-binding protein [Paenirhodobacter sp. CAU 1674]|uniref:ABC transporter ATP-binding protein n=1 Tax=Paenirhodobacter sp. CAU 1674 TaxID=3032596 RepID=UPI0023D9ADD5|nr:ABC transporter ATP-binding protein [Paenirhodobacter sp. CAU 1674]MDF2139910.1 ABC transporter ATP-binding protein [Paenirhodobacter sp. CAU 1674]